MACLGKRRENSRKMHLPSKVAAVVLGMLGQRACSCARGRVTVPSWVLPLRQEGDAQERTAACFTAVRDSNRFDVS